MSAARSGPGAGHVPRKRFGQHFLTDAGVIADIVREIDPRPGEAIVEIGPGMGALTAPLLQRSGALTAVELDRDLAARLRSRPGLCVVEADILKVELAGLDGAMGAPERALRMVGNLPYNISSPILFHLLPWAHRVVDQHFMLQREVVERMVAEPGSRTYGRLSVMLQWRYEMEMVLRVPAEAFDPPPAVESAVVRMRPRPHVTGVDPARLSEVVAVAFSQRRKLLRNSLGAWLKTQGASAAFDLQRRAEEVPVEEYVALTQALNGSAPS